MKVYHLSTKDDDYIMDHLNAFNNFEIQVEYVDIKMEEENMLHSLLYFWNNSVVVISSTTQSLLKFEDVFAFLLIEEMRRKSM